MKLQTGFDKEIKAKDSINDQIPYVLVNHTDLLSHQRRLPILDAFKRLLHLKDIGTVGTGQVELRKNLTKS